MGDFPVPQNPQNQGKEPRLLGRLVIEVYELPRGVGARKTLEWSPEVIANLDRMDEATVSFLKMQAEFAVKQFACATQVASDPENFPHIIGPRSRPT